MGKENLGEMFTNANYLSDRISDINYNLQLTNTILLFIVSVGAPILVVLLFNKIFRILK